MPPPYYLRCALRPSSVKCSSSTHAASQAELAKNGFWDYLSQLTQDKGSMAYTQSMKLDQEIKKVKESIQEGVSYMGHLLEKLAPLNRGLQTRFYQDSDSLRRLIRKELEGLRVKLSPYVDEVHQKISKNLEALRFQLTPFTEEFLDQVLLKARELEQHLTPTRDMKAQLLEGVDEVQRFVAQYAKKIAFHTDQVKEVFHPYAARLVTEIHRNMEELHRNVIPHTKVSPEKLHQYIQELSGTLTQNARDLHQKIHRNLDHLKEQLCLYPSGLREHFAGTAVDPNWAVDPYMEGLTQEVQQRIEEFRRDTFLQIDDFTRTIDRETEEMKFKLSPLSPYSEEFQDSSAPLEDLHVRLDSLWKDISQSLNEKSSDPQ
ncbi:apolipoprotein A-V isoform X1 [Emydura macquarii macquarii]|uniref:apolipoprotein A-V isoform X1 n=1 Tax=Emydura macquarii macquarii TaxID=1129001 RepID=UPI00352AD04F